MVLGAMRPRRNEFVGKIPNESRLRRAEYHHLSPRHQSQTIRIFISLTNVLFYSYLLSYLTTISSHLTSISSFTSSSPYPPPQFINSPKHHPYSATHHRAQSPHHWATPPKTLPSTHTTVSVLESLLPQLQLPSQYPVHNQSIFL